MAKRKRPNGKNKKRILLISPPFARLMEVGNSRFPLSFGTIATILSMNHHEVGIYDADFDSRFIGKSHTYEVSFSSQQKVNDALEDDTHLVWHEIKTKIHQFDPHVVGITTMTSKYPMALKIAQIAKRVNPDIQVVVGGHHSSIFGPKLVESNDIDFAVVGEGEMTFLEFMNCLCEPYPDFSRIKGLVWKSGEKIISNRPRELLPDLNILPLANRDLMINDGYVTENNIMTSRGCPFNCSYCGAQVIWKRKVRKRSVTNVAKEVEYLLSRNGSRNINFWDDTFTADKKYTSDLMDELKRFDGITFSCITRFDTIDRPILQKLKEGGCNLILFGIESGNDRVLKLIDKKMSRELIKEKTQLVHSMGIPWLGFFIMGYPGETRENIQETLAFMKELEPTFAEINIFNPLPGTKIWNDLESKGLVSSSMDFSKRSQASTENYFLEDGMSKEEFKELALFMAKEFDAHNRRKNG